MMRYFKSVIVSIFAIFSIARLEAQDYAESDNVHSFAPNSVLAEGNWVKIALNGREDGIYVITYAQLTKMGFKNPDNVGVYGFGGHALDESFNTGHIDDLPEIATLHDNTTKRILFYAQGLISWTYDSKKGSFVQTQNPYASKACYFLHEKDSSALQMEAVASGTSFDDVVSVSDAHLLHEEELVNIGNTGRELYGESFSYNQSQSFSFDEKLLPGEARITANVIANTTQSSTFTIKYGDKVVATASPKTTTNSYVYATESTVSSNFEIEQDTKLAFRVNFNSPITVKTAYLNYLRVEGKQSLSLEKGNDFLLFRNLDSQDKLLKYQVEEAENYQVWDVTDPLFVKRQEWTETGTFVAQEKGLKEYALVNVSGNNFPGVYVVGSVKNQNLHATEPVDFVIVTAAGLRDYAQKLADFRSSHDSLKVKVVTDEEVFNEYSSGTADATAIRLYMKQLFESRQGYLLIFGDGHYNNRKIDGNPNYVVCYETSASLVETSSTVCDDYFGFLDNEEGGNKDSDGRYVIKDNVLDIAVGRIPVHSASAAETAVNKIISYSNNHYYGNWKNMLCFLSDDDKISDGSSDAPNVHMKHNDQVIDVLSNQQGHKEFIYKKIYLPAYTQTTTSSGTDYPDAKKEFLEALQQGVLLVNYAGHGATTSITHEMLMTSSRASQLNMKHLPLWVTASCDISRWDDDEESMGEELLLNPNGGAISLITTTRVVYSQQNLNLNLAVAKYLLKRKEDGTRYRLGDILMNAKQSLGADYNKLNFCLLGDPTMILSYPEYEMEITDVDYSDKVTIKGRVLRAGSDETATDFNGLVYPSIYDKPDSISADKGLFQEPIYKFAARRNKIFSGRDVVRNGLFEFSFFTPKDVSDFTEDGLINLYACNESCDEANGFYDSLIIRKPESSNTDSVGPEISKIFINSSDFRNGDIVGKTPYFFAEVHDESGFNATGNGVGHDLTLTIRSTSNSLSAIKQYTLNNYLSTFTGDPTTGNVRFLIPELDNGEYDVTFKVWDSMNNSSQATLHIVVDGTKINKPLLIQAYPSPVSQGDVVSFRVLHNLPESQTDITLQIFTQSGIKVLEETVSTTSSEIAYLRNSAADYTDIDTSLSADESSDFVGVSTLTWKASVLPGVYIYKVYLTSGDSDSSTDSKILLVKP